MFCPICWIITVSPVASPMMLTPCTAAECSNYARSYRGTYCTKCSEAKKACSKCGDVIVDGDIYVLGVQLIREKFAKDASYDDMYVGMLHLVDKTLQELKGMSREDVMLKFKGI